MNTRNLICWAVVIVGYTLLVVCGTLPAIRFESGTKSAWGRLWEEVEDSPVPGVGQPDPEATRPPPPPPPQPVSRENAGELIRVSVCLNYSDKLIPRLSPSIRLSPVMVDSERELEMGDSRMCAVMDLPPDFQWPRYQDQPLTPLAQIRLSDIADLNGSSVLPRSGWLCFFYATGAEPPITGEQRSDSGAWRVIYSDMDPAALVRMERPAGIDRALPPCRLRFWNEWTLPPLAEEPDLLEDDGQAESGYGDLRMGLAGRPEELGWHHMLGHAQVNTEPMLDTLDQLAGDKPTGAPSEIRGPAAGSAGGDGEWVLLLQTDLEALAELAATPDELWYRPRFSILGDMVYFWIRASDLRARDFSRVWMIRQGYFEDPDEFEEYEESDEEEQRPEPGAPVFGGELG